MPENLNTWQSYLLLSEICTMKVGVCFVVVVFCFCFCFLSITASQVDTVTGEQLVTASQVEIIGCRWQAILSCPYVADGVCVCAAVTALGNMESDAPTKKHI